MNEYKIAIIGVGNIGTSIALGLIQSKKYLPEEIILTRRRVDRLERMKRKGFNIEVDNASAVKKASTIILTVEPLQIDNVLSEIDKNLKPDFHTLISVATGVKLQHLEEMITPKIDIIRAMPNTAITINKSITCLATRINDEEKLSEVKNLFDALGMTLFIEEEKMSAVTALGACGGPWTQRYGQPAQRVKL